MNDAAYEAQQARIMVLHEKWVHTLGFGVWTVRYEWHREAFRDFKGGQTALFRINTEWEYLRVTITVNLGEVEHLEDHELEGHYLHEWGHAFLTMVANAPHEGEGEGQQRAVEHVCTWLGKAFRWVRIAGEGDYKKRRKAKKRAEREAAAAKQPTKRRKA